ncbi:MULTISPECIES: glyoxylate/hydroxypyruvate reductase A [unclassified Roseitalea]|uniref:2-hydroxyacid dehydrogenase n=1 Tax=unclassified Roseitalea TaxID=2639107 RepID=UPI00273FB294|nr:MULTISPECIES: glyoxylate/hydroxypyruvate reductase A [unclassified Roseitalea]
MPQPGKILLSVTGFDPAVWLAALQKHAPDREIVTEPASADDPTIRYAVVWKQRPGVLSGLPNLAAIFSVGAGVDHVFQDPDLPEVPIVRSVADDLTERMSEYVVWQVLDHHRKGPRYRRQQAERVWNEDRMQPAARDVTVGIMGMGILGRDAAEKLKALGFRIAGWSRRPQAIGGVEGFAGDAQLDGFLAISDIVVCLLPLTPATRGILSKPLFARMKRRGPLGPAILINAGRGGLQNEADIVAALDNGWLGAATLDVFNQEPLPATSPLWNHPRVMITPHAAATSMPDALVPPILAQIEAFERGEELRNVVDRQAGY